MSSTAADSGRARRVRLLVLGRNMCLASFVVALLLAVLPRTSEAAAVPGSSGIDTSLPLTDSSVQVEGRGAFSELKIAVNQTSSLVNQAISVTWSGGTPTIGGPARYSENYLQIMQCWGEPDGTVPDNPGPPPEQCAYGATDAVSGGRNTGTFPGGGYSLERIVSRSDFENYETSPGVEEPTTGYKWMPFRSVDGTVIGSHYDPSFNPAIIGGNYWLNPYFNSITTNEIPGGRTGPNGAGSELFEVTTGVESSGLGCGQRVAIGGRGDPAVPQCWLVIVPRGSAAEENVGTPFESLAAQFGIRTSPLAPTAWENRIAIPLEFNPVDSPCDINADQRRIVGTEIIQGAITSWQPQLCSAAGLPPFAYGLVSDASARQQIVSPTAGSAGMAVVTSPADPSLVSATNPIVYAPLGIGGTVIGFNIERNPNPSAPQEALDLAGVRVAHINLTPRLVAKLLTQSYQLQTAIRDSSPYPWALANPVDIAVDPEFLRFNPEFELLRNRSKNLGGLVMPAVTSDAAREVWRWILADPEAKAWLGGEPDEWGMVVNPVYTSVVEAPPESFPKSDPYCFQGPAQGIGGSIVPPLLCGTDWLPYTQSMREAARRTRVADDGARTIADPFALTADRVYRPDGPQLIGSRSILSLTDASSAARYGIQVARLSRAGDTGDDRQFVAPTPAAMQNALGGMVPSAVDTFLVSDAAAMPEDAYPLTSLVYGATAPLALETELRSDYASFIEYAVGPGQVPGPELGQLPVGYSSLTDDLKEDALVAAKAIREMQAPPVPEPVETAPVSGPFPQPSAPASSPGTRSSTAATTAMTPPVVEEIAIAEVVADTPRDAGPLTPILALARNRYFLVVLLGTAVVSTLVALEITKRPRRRSVTGAGDR